VKQQGQQKMRTQKTVTGTSGIALLVAATAMAQGPRENLALGKSYRWSMNPNYKLSTDAGDSTQLTDGHKTVKNYLWGLPTSVGWVGKGVTVDVVIDLGEKQPIDEVRMTSSSREASGVKLPASLSVSVSDDGETFYVVKADEEIPNVPTTPTRPLSVPDLHTAGRYVMLSMESRGLINTDEIEVYKGDFDVSEGRRTDEEILFIPAAE
jgi:hypothetical protein